MPYLLHLIFRLEISPGHFLLSPALSYGHASGVKFPWDVEHNTYYDRSIFTHLVKSKEDGALLLRETIDYGTVYAS